MSSPLFNPSFCKLQSCEGFCCPTERAGAGQCSPGVLSTDWVPHSSTGHLWWKLNWEQEDWDGEFLSPVRTSRVSEAAQQQGMRPNTRLGCERAQHQEGRAVTGWLQTDLNSGLEQMPETCSMFGHIKYQSRIISCCFWCWPKISDFFSFLISLVF